MIYWRFRAVTNAGLTFSHSGLRSDEMGSSYNLSVVMNSHYLNIPSKVPASNKTTSFASLGKNTQPGSVYYYLPQLKICTS